MTFGIATNITDKVFLAVLCAGSFLNDDFGENMVVGADFSATSRILLHVRQGAGS